MVINPYQQCPVYQSPHYLLRIVNLEDTRDLLSCYADPLAAPIFNSDNCTSDFVYHTLEEMQECIKFWLDSYVTGHFIRFSVVDLATQKAVGTIECFAKPETFEQFGKVAVLRLDLASMYEKPSTLLEILQLVDENFFDCFAVNSLITKAVKPAQARITALLELDYKKLEPNPIMPYPEYYIKLNTSI